MQPRLKQLGVVIAGAALSAALTGVALAEGPTVSGFVDFGYNYNLSGAPLNTYRAFDGQANSFTLQNAEIVVAGKSAQDVSYRVDVDYGTDGGIVNNFDGTGDDQIDLQQAFISMPCPWTHGTVTVGKFVTPFGAEVIEAKDNYNYSRGVLFTNAIPLVHTGLKYDKGFMDGKYTVTGGIVNGWDSSVDGNKGKTLLVQGGFNAIPKVNVTLGGAYGPEVASPPFVIVGSTQPSTESMSRTLVDLIVKFTPTDKLTLLANFDYGVDEGGAFAPTASDDTTANWAGAALYANYMFNEKCSGAVRYENFDDEGSRLTATAPGGPIHQVINSLTVTLQHKMNDVITRLEYRTDMSTQKVYTKGDGTLDDTESTLGFQIIYAF